MSELVRVRFAPSPTGLLHIGNARTALFNWLFAKKHNGKFILRIEDTDIERSSEHYITHIIDDLKWLGITWDEGPDVGGNYGPYRQSLRLKIYKEYLKKLKQKNIVYPCYCSEEELNLRRQIQISKGIAPKYDNRCRNLSQEEIKRLNEKGKTPVWRFRVPQKKIILNDLIYGEIEFNTSLIGDFIVFRRDGTPTFNFAVTIDDLTMEITHIIRGTDHLSNTPRHLLLFEALDAPIPAFAHIPLITGPNNTPLSKRDNSIAISTLRRLGCLPQAIVNYMSLLGYSFSGKEILSKDEMIQEFSLEKVSRSPSVHDPGKLNWLNSYYIKKLDNAKLLDHILGLLNQEKNLKKPLSSNLYPELLNIINTIKENMTTLQDGVHYFKIFLEETFKIPEEYKAELQNKDTLKVVETLYAKFGSLENFTKKNIEKILNDTSKELGVKGKKLYHPLRIALTGTSEGPQLLDILLLLGKNKVIRRLKQCLSIR